MSTVSGWAERLLGAHALSARTFAVVFAPAAVITLVGDPAYLGVRPLTWLVIILIATAIAMGVFLGAGRLRRLLPEGPGAQLMSWMGAGLAAITRAVVIGLLGSSTGVTGPADWVFRIVGGGVIGLVLVPIAAALVYDYVVYVRVFDERERVAHRLSRESERGRLRLAAARAELLGRVNLQLAGSTAALVAEARPGRTGEEYRDLVRRIVGVIDDVVRPLARELSGEAIGTPTFTGDVPSRTVRLRALINYASGAEPFRPIAVSLTWVLLSSSFFAAIKLSALQLWAGPAFWGTIFVALAVGKWVVFPLIRSRGPVVRAGLVIAWYALTATAGGVVAWLLLNDVYAPQFRLLSLTLLVMNPLMTMVLCAWLAGLAGLREARVKNLEFMWAQAAELERNVASVRGQVRGYRLTLSRALHGDVQSRLLAYATRLQAAVEADAVSNELLEEIRREISALGTVTAEPRGYPSFAQAIDDLRALWGGGLRIDLEGDPVALQVLEENLELRMNITDLCTEAVVNAAKHASASRITVQLRYLAESHAIGLGVDNDGRAPGQNQSQGSGTRLADDISSSWRISRIGDKTRFVAEIPIPRW